MPRAILTTFAAASLLAGWGVAFAQPQSESLGEQEEAAIRAAVARVDDSVVQIRTIGGLEEVDRTLMPDGPTTGVLISSDGWIVSSAFNFAQPPASILVTFASGEQVPAKLVAEDHSRMLVLLKIEGNHERPVAEMMPVADVHVGQWAIAVGRTYRADKSNISVGVVSAVNRMLGKAIQTDAHVSVANYGGPLVDIRGRVLGIIVPMAPQATSEVAGAEWYDSGIGFAVPLSSIEPAIERMKHGEDQYPGILGVSFAMGLAPVLPAEIAAVRPNSPAGMAGFRKDDRIVAIEDKPIASQTDVRFALGNRYAGETIQVKVKRGSDELTRPVTLAGKLEAFRHAFLGVLPMRPDMAPKVAGKSNVATGETKDGSKDGDGEGQASAPEADKAAKDSKGSGVVIRAVYPNSPAAEAGIHAGDRLIRIDDANSDSTAAAIAAMNAYAPEAKIGVHLIRDDKPLDVTATLVPLPTNIPNELPPAFSNPIPPTAKQSQPPTPAAPPKLDIRDLKLAEFTESCQVYVPPSHEAGHAAGVLFWLHAPGEPPTEELFRQWQSICDRDGLLLVAPKSADPTRWERTEIEYLRRLIERVVGQYRVDPFRVVVYGQGGGGAMAATLALASRDIVSGLAMNDAPLPRTAPVPDNDPSARLAVWAGLPADDSQAAIIRQGLKKISDAGYPITVVTMKEAAASPTADEREQLARWIDSLDRF
jgi:serine protease Do